MKKYYYLVILLIVSLIYLFPVKSALAVDPKFRRPMNIQPSPLINYYYDNRVGSGTRIYTCATTPPYDGHQGTDFRTPSIGNSVYAGANGGLYYRYDACATYGAPGSTCGGGYGNYAKIDHEGNLTDGIGWVTIYAHLKQGTVVWPMCVMCSAYVGQSGSSGNSSGPHLHFEVKKYSYPWNDPFTGACSGSVSFWVNQNGGIPTTTCQ